MKGERMKRDDVMIGRADGWPAVNDGGQSAGQVSGMEKVLEAAGSSTDPAGFRGCSVYKLRNRGAVPEKFVG